MTKSVMNIDFYLCRMQVHMLEIHLLSTDGIRSKSPIPKLPFAKLPSVKRPMVEGAPIFRNELGLYSLSDSSLATAFCTFLLQNVQVYYPNLVNLLGALLCINI